jgi:L-histidine Nalpha-methyltransferase / hercynylcysteine S-oxide synthase
MPVSWVDESVTSSEAINGVTSGDANGALNGQTDANGWSEHSSLDRFVEGKSVRTVFGLVPLRLALDWPVFASYDELAGCAAWMGGRVPTMEEAKSIYNYADHLRKEQAERKLGRMVPAVNG